MATQQPCHPKDPNVPRHRHRNQRSKLIGTVPVALLVAVLAAVAGSSPTEAGSRIAAAPEARTYAWSLDQVRVLIREVDASRRHGLDPAAYGLAALRAELVLCEQLWNTPGSRQLDTLARAAALALANDYRRLRAETPAPVRAAELDAVLGAGQVGPWLAGMAPAQGRAS
jgi:hypothetical protein